jgi:hypothetical protein
MTSYLKYNDYNKSIKCYFCNGNHACRDCPKEAELAPTFRKRVGGMFEYWTADNIKCQNCNCKTLKVIGNHTPSLDLICQNPECNKKYEVKSKCLSVSKLPSDIKLPHGSYNDYLYRLKEGLNLIVIIYGVDRVKKTISIREVIYANNDDLLNENLIEVEKRTDSNLSTIMIKNKNLLNKLQLDTQNTCLSFQNDVNKNAVSVCI